MEPIPGGTGDAMQQKNDVVVYIDTIDDIYSDFDPRNINIRVLSVDFINEVRLQARQSTEKTQIKIKIFAPKYIRRHELSRKVEKITKRRILMYFEDEYWSLNSDRIKKLVRALLFLVSGLSCFFIVKLIGDIGNMHLVLKTLLELITFLSWFATWKGIESLVDLPKRREVLLHRRLADAEIHFNFVKDITAINIV